MADARQIGATKKRWSRSRAKAVAVALSVAALVIVPAAALGVQGDFFQPSTSPEAAGAFPASVAAASLNGDANTDLAVANDATAGTVTILLGDGTGNFTAAGTSPESAGNRPKAIAAANLGGDANTDLAVANRFSDNVTILLGDGTGNFTAAGTSPESAGDGPFSVTAANLGGDASLDLAVANSGTDNVTILLGDGTGNFTAAGTSPEGAGDFPQETAAANLGGDANIDLAVTNLLSDSVTILLGDGTGNFTAAGTSPEGAGDLTRGIAAASLNGDANIDLAVASNGGGVTILLGDGTGNFTAAGTSPESAGTAPDAITAASLGGDANTDLAVANIGSANVSILLGDGTGNFTAAGTSPESAGTTPSSIAAANLGGTASTDLAVTNTASGSVSILLNDFVASAIPPVNPIPPVVNPIPPVVPPPVKQKCKKKKKKKGKTAAAAAKGCKKKKKRK